MIQRKASEIKPGDRIGGAEVFDTLRRTFGGFYLPMVDGTRIEVPSADTLIEVENQAKTEKPTGMCQRQ
ncbi:MAG: hypothetical protein KDB00_11540 [Planctomycetales bacterium]|nr:hypothetical protein [Planctomycetales bacterium]